MKYQRLLLIVALFSTGCVAFSLERRTVNQILSITDFRYQEVLHSLAVVAANPAVLPPYTLISDGTAQVTDTATLTSQTLWNRTVNSFSTETLMAQWLRNPQPNWTVDPVANHDQLEAIRCACQWVLSGREIACNGCGSLLASPAQDSSPGPHFDVAWRLERLPPCWLHVGGLKDVPAHACYKAHCGHTWVWVMPGDLEGLSQFTLVLQDIATRDPNNMAPPRVTIDLIRPAKIGGVPFPDAAQGERRTVKPEFMDILKAQLLNPNIQVREIDWDNYTAPIDSTALRTNVSPSGGASSANMLRNYASPRSLGLQSLRSQISARSFK